MGIAGLVVAGIVVLCLGGCQKTSKDTRLSLANSGQTKRVILIPDDATPPTKNAADQLALYLGKITGAQFPVVKESAALKGTPVLSVGLTKRFAQVFPDLNPSALKPDGIIMKTKGDDLFLAGQGTRGDLYAVYSFLEDECGVRWWTSTESTIPRQADLVVPSLDRIHEPVFMSREAYYHDMVMEGYGRLGKPTPEQEQFAVKMKNNGNNSPVSPDWGGKLELLGWAHTFTQILPLNKYLKDHPDWFSTIQPWSAQLDLTNEALFAEFIKNTRAWLDKNPGIRTVSISQNDSHEHFQSSEQKRIEAEEGSPSGLLLRFVNRVADELKKSHPGVLVETLAYAKTETPPKITRPGDTVIVRLAPIYAMWSQPLEGSTFKENQQFMGRLKSWSAIASRLYIWDYTVNYTNLLLPHPNLYSLGPNIKTYADNHVVGVFAQGNAYSPVGDFDELKSWLICHMLWNPSCDPDQLIQEFVSGYYGPAAEPVMKVINLIQAAGKNHPLTCYALKADWLDLATMNEATRLLDQAEAAANGAPDILRRVRKAKLPIAHQWLLGWRKYRAQSKSQNLPFLGPSDPVAGLEKFRAACALLHATHVSEGAGYTNTMARHLDALKNGFLPPTVPLPPPYDKVARGNVVDFQENLLTLFNGASIVPDRLASNGKAAKMGASDTGWNIQLHQVDKAGVNGRWRCLAMVRIEAEGLGPATTFAVHGNRTKINASTTAKIEDLKDGQYHLLDAGVVDFDGTDWRVIYFAPHANPDKVRAIFVDRVFLVRE